LRNPTSFFQCRILNNLEQQIAAQFCPHGAQGTQQ
jgi:hypothetical protein